jgi:hypothetical protein
VTKSPKVGPLLIFSVSLNNLIKFFVTYFLRTACQWYFVYRTSHVNFFFKLYCSIWTSTITEETLLFFDAVDFIMDSDPALQHKEEVDESRLSFKQKWNCKKSTGSSVAHFCATSNTFLFYLSYEHLDTMSYISLILYKFGQIWASFRMHKIRLWCVNEDVDRRIKVMICFPSIYRYLKICFPSIYWYLKIQSVYVLWL